MWTVAERGGDRQALITGLTGAPVLAGNSVDILYDGGALLAMLEAVEDAERAVDMMTYVWWGGEVAERFAEALAGRAEAGVRVRVLVDSIGSKMDAHVERRMREAGVVLEFFRPYATWKLWQVNMRTHRRVLVCDAHHHLPPPRRRSHRTRSRDRFASEPVTCNSARMTAAAAGCWSAVTSRTLSRGRLPHVRARRIAAS
jgi:phosphatidylserine/phosphatidylglycerophosphate/cardiolipin synthase-like enzyme